MAGGLSPFRPPDTPRVGIQQITISGYAAHALTQHGLFPKVPPPSPPPHGMDGGLPWPAEDTVGPRGKVPVYLGQGILEQCRLGKAAKGRDCTTLSLHMGGWHNKRTIAAILWGGLCATILWRASLHSSKSPLACMRVSSFRCFSESLGCLPRNLPLARATAILSRARRRIRSASNSANVATRMRARADEINVQRHQPA